MTESSRLSITQFVLRFATCAWRCASPVIGRVTCVRFGALLAILVSSLIATGTARAQTSGTAAHNSCECSSLTLAKPVAAGADRTLLVSVAMIAGSETLSTVTYNGSAMTQIGSAEHTGNARIYLFEQKLGTGGAISANVVVTRSSSAKMVVGAHDFAGVNQAQTLTTTGTSGKSRVASVTRSGVVSGQVVVDAIAMKSVPSPSLSVGAGQTLLWSQNQSSNGTGAQSQMAHSGSTGAVTVSYDKGSGNQNEWAMLATTLTAPSPPSISVTKSTTSTFTAAASSLTYAFTVRNTGSVTVSNVSLSDPLLSGSSLAGCAASSLAAGAQTTCSATYTTTQADVDAGQVVNTASATSTETGAVSSNTVTVPFTGTVTRALSVSNGTTSTFTAVGQVLTYNFTVQNTGNVTLTNISLSDPLVSTAPLSACAAATLAPNAQTTCSGSYTTTQADVDARQVVNTATASSTETGAVTSNVVTLPFSGKVVEWLTVVASSTSAFTAAGVTLAYDFSVENTGNVTLTNISLSAPLVSDSPIAACAAATLSPGAKTTCSGSYVTTQADVDAGQVANTAAATSTETGSVSSNTLTLTFAGTLDKMLLVTKETTSTFTGLGQLLTFAFTVENTGNVTLTDVSLRDPLMSDSPIAACAAATLAPGAKTTCSGSYTTTQADLDAGAVVNTATATSTQTGSVLSNTVKLPFGGSGPALSVVKSTTSTFTAAGVTLAYDFTVQNTGNITLENVSLKDPLVSSEPIAGCFAPSLSPGEKMRCSATYTTTTSDVADGHVKNTATATSVQTGAVSSNTVTLPFTPTAVPSFSVVKSSASQFTGVGERLVFDYVLKNTGNVTLTNLNVSDALVSNAPLPGCAVASLAAGATASCSGSYTTTQADVDAGQVSGSATAVSTQTGSTSSNVLTVAFSGAVVRSLTVLLESNATFTGAGQSLIYDVTVENAGTVTLTGVSVSTLLSTEPLAACTAASLAPGARITCSTTHTATHSDVAAGQIANQATVVSADSEPVSSNTLMLTFAGQLPAVEPSLSVSAVSSHSTAVAGAAVVYEYVIENTGNVPLSDVSLTTSLSSGAVSGCSRASLAPGDKVTCTASYTPTPADLYAGRIEHIATATSTETGAVSSSTVLVLVTIDEQLVRETFSEATQVFMWNRLNGILMSEPESHRLINRGGGGSDDRPIVLTGQGNQDRMNLAWGTSLQNIRRSAARSTNMNGQPGGDRLDGMGAAGARFDLWVEGTYYRHKRTLASGQERGEVGLAYTGIDYLLGKHVLVGVLTQFDWASSTASGLDGQDDAAQGFGWMAGPYASARLGGVLLDVRGAWGRSKNDLLMQVSGVDFDSTFTTKRRLVRVMLSGETSLHRLRIRPTAALAYMQDKQSDYVARSARNAVLVDGLTLGLGRMMAGPEMSYRIAQAGGGHVEPFFAPSLVWDVQRDGTTFEPYRSAGTRRGALVTGVRFMLRGGITGDAVLGVDGLGDRGFVGSSVRSRVIIPF